MDGTCLVGEGSFQVSEGMRAEVGVGEDLAEVGRSAVVNCGVCLKKKF